MSLALGAGLAALVAACARPRWPLLWHAAIACCGLDLALHGAPLPAVALLLAAAVAAGVTFTARESAGRRLQPALRSVGWLALGAAAGLALGPRLDTDVPLPAADAFALACMAAAGAAVAVSAAGDGQRSRGLQLLVAAACAAAAVMGAGAAPIAVTAAAIPVLAVVARNRGAEAVS